MNFSSAMIRAMRRRPKTHAAGSFEPPLSPGEVNFLWWFIQGSIMDVETRYKLRGAWGLCERHAMAWIAVEAAFRHCHFHGPAIVYAELMASASRALAVAGPFAGTRLARRLRAKNGCLMCELAIGSESPGYAPAYRLEIGRDLSQLRGFVEATEPYWRKAVCGRCDRSMAQVRCRVHLLQDLAQDPLLCLQPHRDLVANVAGYLARYDDSFRWERRGTDTVEDRAALLSAVGWCGGWATLVALLG